MYLKIDFPIRSSKSMMFSGSPNIYMFVVQNPGFKNMNDHLFWGIHHMLKFRSVSWPTEGGKLRNITYVYTVKHAYNEVPGTANLTSL